MKIMIFSIFSNFKILWYGSFPVVLRCFYESETLSKDSRTHSNHFEKLLNTRKYFNIISKNVLKIDDFSWKSWKNNENACRWAYRCGQNGGRWAYRKAPIFSNSKSTCQPYNSLDSKPESHHELHHNFRSSSTNTPPGVISTTRGLPRSSKCMFILITPGGVAVYRLFTSLWNRPFAMEQAICCCATQRRR